MDSNFLQEGPEQTQPDRGAFTLASGPSLGGAPTPLPCHCKFQELQGEFETLQGGPIRDGKIRESRLSVPDLSVTAVPGPSPLWA